MDFSRDSKAALRFSSRLRFLPESANLLLHVVTSDEELRRLEHASNLTEQFGQLRSHLIERVRRHLQKLADQFLPAQHAQKVLVREGNPGEEILSVLHSEQVDLAVLGSRGHSGIKRFFLGSVSDWVVQEAPCPVLVVRGAGRTSNLPLRIMMATDGSPEAQRAAVFLNRFSFLPQSQIVLFHVIEPTDYTVVQDDFKILGLDRSGLRDLRSWAKAIQRKREQAQAALLQRTKQVINRRNVKVEKISVGYAAEEIIKASIRFRADLIVMGSRGMTGVRKMYLGSVSSRVARHAPCSVLVVHSSEKRSKVSV